MTWKTLDDTINDAINDTLNDTIKLTKNEKQNFKFNKYLQDDNLISREGSNKTGFWKIK